MTFNQVVRGSSPRWLTREEIRGFPFFNSETAPVAELADAPDLGSGGRPCRFKSCQAQNLRQKKEQQKLLFFLCMEGYNESLIKEIKNNKEEYFHESGKYDTIQMICVKSGIYLGIRRENMKKIRKIGSVAIVLVMMLTLLCGCESMQKKKAMMKVVLSDGKNNSW